MSAESAKGSGNVVPLRSAAQAVGRYSPSQRAAIIIAVLGENAARPIIEKLDDAALARVAGTEHAHRDSLGTELPSRLGTGPGIILLSRQRGDM